MMIPVQFKSSGSTIQGFYFPAAREPALASVIFLQGFPGVEGDELICAQLARAQIHVLTFNYRGTFQSGGVFSFSNAIADIEAVWRFVTTPGSLEATRIDVEEVVLGGWSFGSGILPVGAASIPECQRIFLIAGRNFAEEARRIEGDPKYAEQVRRNLAAIRKPAGPVELSDEMLDDLIHNKGAFEFNQLISRLVNRQILLISGRDDDVAPGDDYIIPFYRALVAQGASQARMEILPGDHEFSGCKDALVQLIVDWLRGG